jgi:cell wall-associated NlpC family hydrolase
MKPIQYIRQAFYRGLVNYLVAPVSVAPVQQPRSDLQSLLQAGDVILVAGKTRFASLVCRLTQSTWSHVAIYVGPGHHADPAHCIVEADVEAGVRMITLDHLADHDIQVVRASRLPETSRQELIDYLLARVGRPYDLNHVIALARLMLLAPSTLGRWLAPRMMRPADPTRAVCSTLVAHALFTAGVSLGASPVVAARLRHVVRKVQADDLKAALDYLVPGDFERLPEFVSVFNSRPPSSSPPAAGRCGSAAGTSS